MVDRPKLELFCVLKTDLDFNLSFHEIVTMIKKEKET
jgi:hypothetical protein